MWKCSGAWWSSGGKEGYALIPPQVCGGPGREDLPVVGELCAIPVDRLRFPCFTCPEDIVDESELRLSEEGGS